MLTFLFTIYFKLLKIRFQILKVKYISKTEIYKIIKFLKPTSHGYDEISMKLLKAVVHLIGLPIMFYLQSVFVNWDLSIRPKIFCNKTSI